MSKTISSYYSSGITLTTADSPVTVTNSGTINAATGDGLLGSDPYAWVVDNAGTIISSQVVGIDLNGTTTVTNEATGTIIGSTYGVVLGGAVGTLSNAGTIAATGTYGIGVNLVDGGAVYNTADAASITGVSIAVAVGIGPGAAAGTVVNAGTISATGPDSFGVSLASGGTVSNNAATAQISGTHDGIYIGGAAGTVHNLGTISGTGAYNVGVGLGSGGVVTNDQVGSTGGTIQGTAVGISLSDGGTVINGASGIAASPALIYGGTFGVYSAYNAAYAAATITNYGTIAGSSLGPSVGIALATGGQVTNAQFAVVYGYATAIASFAAATIDNAGTVQGGTLGGTGVVLHYGGTVTNAAGGTILGGDTGIYAGGSYSSIDNAGTIAGGTYSNSYGIALGAAASIINAASGTIYGADVGIIGFANAVTTIDNSGSIAGGTYANSYGIALYGGGSVTNHASGTITDGIHIEDAAATIENAGSIGGGRFGVYIGQSVTGATVINIGTISGTSYSVNFYGTNDVLVDDPGAVFDGSVLAGGSDTLELAAGANPGALSGLGSSFYGFGTVAIDSGATWGITGSFGGIVINSGTLLSSNYADLILDGTVINAGLLEAPFYIQSGGYLTNQSTGVISGDVEPVTPGAIPGALVAADATVVNDGQIINTSTNASAFGAYIQVAGTFTNSGTVSGGSGLGAQSAAVPTINNSGLIESTGTNGYGINLQGGGIVTNSGMILGTLGQGIVAKVGGTVTNTADGTISGYTAGVMIFDSPAYPGDATVINAGIIDGTDTFGMGVGVSLNATTNFLSNTGTITGTCDAVDLGNGGTVINDVSGTSVGYISGPETGIYVLVGTGTITNFGTILARGPAIGEGVILSEGGSIINGQPGGIGYIYGYASGISITGGTDGTTSLGAGTLTNYGTVIGHNNVGVELDQGGSVANGASGATSAYIHGGNYGVRIDFTNTAPNLPGTVVNYGTITSGGNGTAVFLRSSGTLVNAYSGTITGYIGVQIFDAAGFTSTVTNAGTIAGTGPLAVELSSPGNDRLIDVPGAVFIGIVSGAGGTLELATGASAGILSGLGTQFGDFLQITIDANAAWTLSGPASVINGTAITIGNGASLDATGDITGSADFVLGGGSLTLAGSIDAGTSFDFADTSNIGPDLLTLDDVAAASTSFTNAITGFSLLDEIVLPNVTFDTSVAPIIDSIGHTVTLALAGGAGNFVFDNFAFQPGAHKSLTVGTDSIEGAVCFLRGTRILTERGEIAVEALAIGDRAITLSGEAKPITWIGTGRALVTRGKRTAATPIIVRKGALAKDTPTRDLRITKGHSLFLDDVLIPAEFLINHRSILWDDHAKEVEIFHVELDTHDVLLADGAPAESYRDDGNRWVFRNVNSFWHLPAKPPCAPVLTGGPIVDAVWRRLLDRAGPRPGLPMTDEADLHLLMDGRRIDGQWRPDGSIAFTLPWRPAELRLVSRAGSPAELGLARDPRLLGVAVRQIRLWRGRRLHVIEASDPCLTDGFHLFETGNGFRWTDGNAMFPASLFEHVRGASVLEVVVASTANYPLMAERIAA